MKREFKGFIVGVIITVMLMSTVTLAGGVKQKIEVMLNSVNLAVNGKSVKADNILYKGTTYVPLRAVAEMLGKEVGWDKNTNTASINDKKTVDNEKTGWKEVATFEGNSIKDTKTFKITSNEWRIRWETKPGDMGDMNFQIYTYKTDGDLVGVDANIIGEGNDISYKREKGEYYLTINTAQPYKIIVEQK